ncbi:serine/threonine-protein kinase 11-interacting protein-like isoform X3 [Penaeus japonicus]|uniref:serine/threonine-protein kinase 11-interacting protein-like isoform X3 n=1 Tax=Penaeus japonicus TaxID=27405 RepID=UPI001C712739|nr:serine/threonine-protein kinase 11-interacting protein-like isoform X3 [Penaeus japonicus]
MDDALLQRVCSLATAFRQSAHLLLDHKHKLSLDTWTLGEIQEAFSLILEMEQHTNFHVLPPNHRQHPAIPHLQFIYDLLQKIFGLRLWVRHGLGLPLNETISLRCFRNLQTLEMDHIPVTSMKALQTLRPTLKSVTVVKGLQQLSDLFIKCGADKASEFAWEQLQEAVLAHNPLHSLDQSLKLLPSLKILDLSHCELEEASALEYLPTVTMLDISHNRLRLLPRLSPTATYSLTILIANNNLISHISGLHDMSNIEELDLRDNVLCMNDVLSPIGALPHLRILQVSGNPFTWDINYRIHTIRLMNPATANHKVLLDKEAFTSLERATVGIESVPAGSPYSPELVSSLFSLSSLCSPVHPFLTTPGTPSMPFLSPEEAFDSIQPASMGSQPASLVHESVSASLKSSGNGQTRRRSRKKVTRHIDITDPDEEEWDSDSIQVAENDGFDRLGPSHVSLLDGVPDPPPPSLAIGHTFPPVSGDTVSQALSSLTLKAEVSRPAASEQSDKLLEEILQSKTQSGIQGSSSEDVPESAENSSKLESTLTGNQTSSAETKAAGVADEQEKDCVDVASSQVTGEQETNIEGKKDDQSIESGLESSFYRGSSTFSRHSSEDLTPPHSDSEDEKDDVQLILAKREMETLDEGKPAKAPAEASSEGEVEDEGKEEDASLQDVILAITSSHFKEKHNYTARTLYKWELLCIESMELLSTSPHKILITFSTIRPAYKTRTYVLDPGDYQTLAAVLTPILERNTLQEVLHSAMKCVKCETQFSRDLARQSEGTLKCPNCGGGVVVRAENVDHPNNAFRVQDGPRSSTPITQAVVQNAPSTAPSSESDSCPGESSESVSVCSEASSCVRRESDVEVISNPSVSSIEVLSEQQIIHEEEGEEQKPPMPAVLNTDARSPANSPSINHKPELVTNMQESSSSGSMTGSVCTTYEKTGSVPTSPLKLSSQQPQIDTVDSKDKGEESANDSSNLLYKTAESSLQVSMAIASTSPHSAGSSPRLLSSSSTSIDTVKNGNSSPTLHHKGVMTSIQDYRTVSEGEEQKSLASWVQSLLHTLTGYYWPWWEEVENAEGVEKSVNPIRYSYEDFADVDHRLKLHCEVLLFHEPGEQLLGLVKAVLLIQGGKREFQGILAVSNKKLYILEIVAQEDDSPQTWLELNSCHSLNEVTTVHSLYQRQGLALSVADNVVLISLADSHRANCFFNFLSETLEECGVSPNIQECSPAQEEVLTDIVKEVVGPSEEEGSLSIFAIVSLLLDGGCSESQFLVISETDLVMFHADLEWYLPPAPACKLKLNQTQKIANITAIEVHSDSHIALQFFDEVTGAESSWMLHVTSSVAACHIIQAIRTPWSQLFSVDLQDFIGVYRTKEGDLLSMTRMLTESVAQEVQKEKREAKCAQDAEQEWYQVAAIPGTLKYDPKYPILGYSDISSQNVHGYEGVDEINSYEACEVSCEEDTTGDCCSYGSVSVDKETKDMVKSNVYDEIKKTAPVFEEKSNGDSNVLFSEVT